MKCDTEQRMKWDSLYKVDSECKFNLWPDSSDG